MVKKAQAAMEFLMSYGWAILVALIVISAIAYMGFLNINRNIASKCSFGGQLPCTDVSFDFTNKKIFLALKNNIGFNANVSDYISIKNGCTNYSMNLINGMSPPQVVKNSGSIILEISCPDMKKGNFKSDMTIKYLNTETGILQSHSGEIIGIV